MAINQTNYASYPKTAVGVLSAANTARDGTGTIVTILTAGASGTLVDDIVFTATATTTAGMLRLFLHDGTNARLLKEIPVAAITPSATVAAWTSSLSNQSILLQSGWSLRASTEKAEAFNVSVTRAGDF